MLINNLLLFFTSAFFMVISAVFLVKSLSKITRVLKISEFVISFLIIGIATSLPELFTGISSAISGNPALSLGNIIGANILNMTLVVGILIIFSRGMEIKKNIMKNEAKLMMFSIFLLIILYLIGNSLSRTDGIILVSLFCINIFMTFKKNKKSPMKTNPKKVKGKQSILPWFILVISVLVLFFSSKFAVLYAKDIALNLAVSQILVGLLLISIITTLPELIFGISAVLLKHSDMSLGNQVGSVFANICFILGIVAIIHPIKTELVSFLISSIFMLLAGLFFLFFIKSGKKLTIKKGIYLIIFYLVFAVVEILFR